MLKLNLRVKVKPFKDTLRGKVLSNQTLVLRKRMNMNIWVVGTSN